MAAMRWERGFGAHAHTHTQGRAREGMGAGARGRGSYSCAGGDRAGSDLMGVGCGADEDRRISCWVFVRQEELRLPIC